MFLSGIQHLRTFFKYVNLRSSASESLCSFRFADRVHTSCNRKQRQSEDMLLLCSLQDLTISSIRKFPSTVVYENDKTVAATLYDEGAVIVIFAILVNCRFMLERSSNRYDYLVDEGTECNAISDLILERNRELSIVDLLVPSLMLLIELLQKLQEANEQHRNTKLMNALLRLLREISPKLAACAADPCLLAGIWMESRSFSHPSHERPS